MRLPQELSTQEAPVIRITRLSPAVGADNSVFSISLQVDIGSLDVQKPTLDGMPFLKNGQFGAKTIVTLADAACAASRKSTAITRSGRTKL